MTVPQFHEKRPNHLFWTKDSSPFVKFITDSIKRDLSNTTNMTKEEIDGSIGDGYISISVVYAVFALSNFFSSAIVKLFGHKAAMVSFRT